MSIWAGLRIARTKCRRDQRLLRSTSRPLTGPVPLQAVADAFETLQVTTGSRPPFTEWAAIEEIEKGKGVTFASEAVTGLRQAMAPDRVVRVRLQA